MSVFNNLYPTYENALDYLMERKNILERLCALSIHDRTIGQFIFSATPLACVLQSSNSGTDFGMYWTGNIIWTDQTNATKWAVKELAQRVFAQENGRVSRNVLAVQTVPDREAYFKE